MPTGNAWVQAQEWDSSHDLYDTGLEPPLGRLCVQALATSPYVMKGVHRTPGALKAPSGINSGPSKTPGYEISPYRCGGKRGMGREDNGWCHLVPRPA